MDVRKRVLIVLLLSPVLVKAQTVPSAPIYSYSVPDGGYASNGNLTAYTDSVTGTWSAQYDNLNRLAGATATGTSAPSQPFAGATISWLYDTFGNRTTQAASGTPRVAVPSGWAEFDVNNRMTTNQNAVTPHILKYDDGGNMTVDNINQYLYDAENRICAVYDLHTQTITQYLYDAEGRRVAKGHPSPDTTALYCPTSRADFTPDVSYIVGPSGEQISELDGAGTWVHSNVLASGQLIATYDQEETQQLLHFHISDALGSRRVQASAAGAWEQAYLNLPFGDGYNVIGSGRDATEHHFTGKERDTESGNDYMFARYYNSATGRFLSPDWSAKVAPVPYAKLDNPQSLHLYSYTYNNPLGSTDADGHWPSAPMALFPSFGDVFKSVVKSAVNLVNFFGGDSGHPASLPPLYRPSNPTQAFTMGAISVASLAVPVFDAAFGGSVTVTAATPAAIEPEAATLPSLLSQAETARDALASEVGASKATVTGAYNSETGQVTAAACGGGQCAEDVANGQLQGGATNFTKAVRPRTGNEVPICERCEATYGRDKFPSDAQFKSDEP